MTTDRDKCSISSFLPISCRGRAEAFARRLQSRLRTLGSRGSNGVDETTWLAANENPPITLSQPRHTSDANLFLDLNLMESPSSPPEEIDEAELQKIINENNLVFSKADYYQPQSLLNQEAPNSTVQNIKSSASYDSDSSDGPFYDTVDSEVNVQQLSATTNRLVSEEQIPKRNGDNDFQDASQDITNECENESFSSVISSTPHHSASTLSDNLSTSGEDASFSSVFSSTTRNSSSTSPENSSSTSSDNLSSLSLKDDDSISQNSSPDTEVFEITIRGTEKAESEINKQEESGSISEPKKPDDTHVSAFTVDKDLTVEYNPNITEAKIQILEIKIEDEIKTEEDEYGEENAIPRVRRCSSLKTGKTPPGTPGRKKIVRFADVLGLDLADVRTFLDDVPNVPSYAYNDIGGQSALNCESNTPVCKLSNKILVPLFQQPGGQPNFLEMVRDKLVCLENAIVEDSIALSITGTVRVRNLDFHKSVHIRYSLDGWKSFADVQAVYVQNSCDGFSDKFKFLLYANSISVGQRLEIAVRYQCKGSQYWDSNNGLNYCFQCLPGSTNTSYTPLSLVDDFVASFY